MTIYVKFDDGSKGFFDVESIDKWMNENFPISLAVKEIHKLVRVY